MPPAAAGPELRNRAVLSPIEEPPVRRVRWPEAHRIVPSRYPPVQLFERLSGDPAEWETLAEIESLTNPRIRDEIGEIHLVPVEDRVSGTRRQLGHGAVHPRQPERLTVLRRQLRRLLRRARAADRDRRDGVPHGALLCRDRRSAARRGHARADRTHRHDLPRHPRRRPELGATARSGQLRRQPRLRPQAARRGQQRHRLSERAPRRRPVRRRLRPKAVGLPIQGRHLQYHWDGSRISRYFDYAEERWVPLS